MFMRVKTLLLLAEDPLGKNHSGAPFINSTLFIVSLQLSKKLFAPSGAVTEVTPSCGGKRTKGGGEGKGGEGMIRERGEGRKGKREKGREGGRGETSIKGPTSNRGFW